jgi:hypothetical protein
LLNGWMVIIFYSFKYHFKVDFRSQGYQESWVSELDVSDDLIRDYNDGFEFANCKKIFCSGKRNELLVQVSLWYYASLNKL